MTVECEHSPEEQQARVLPEEVLYNTSNSCSHLDYLLSQPGAQALLTSVHYIVLVLDFLFPVHLHCIHSQIK